MTKPIVKAMLLALAVCTPALATAQIDRMGSMEYTLGGGLYILDPSLRDFLGSGPAESRFSDTQSPGLAVATATLRLGYNFTRHMGISLVGGGGMGNDVTYLNLGESLTYTFHLNDNTSPFILAGPEITRMTGKNSRVTHSTWGAHVGFGLRHMVSENLAFRAETRIRVEAYQEVPMTRHTTFSPLAQIGFSYFRHATLP